MKKIFLILIILLVSSVLVEASTVSLNATYQVSPNVTRPGAYSTVYLTLANTGVDVSGIIITPTAGPNLKIMSGSKTELGDLPASYSQQASITVKADDNATTTTSYVFVDITYYYGNSKYEKSFYVPINIRGDPILKVENVNFSNSLQPGNTVAMSFDLVNEGLGNAKDITLSLAQGSNFVTSASSGEFFLNNLDRSQSQPITFNLAVSPGASIGTTTIPISLSYSDETRSTNYTYTQYIGAQITGSYNFIAAVESQDVIAPGTSGYVTIKLANGGDQQAMHMLLGFSSPDNFYVNSAIVYVGNLNSDDYDSEKLLLNVGSVNPGYYPLNINVSYDDPFGKSYSEIYSVNFLIASKAEYSLAHPAQTPLGTFVLVAIVLIVIFIIYKKGYVHKLFRRK